MEERIENTDGLCECGCGQPAPLAKKTRQSLGHVKGRPMRFIRGHQGRKPRKQAPAPVVRTPCECGCGLPAPLAAFTNKKRGMVRGQPLQYIHGHNRRKKEPEYAVDPVTGCWEWQYGKSPAGYGLRNNISAHRKYYELFKGPIPPGLVIDHLCYNPGCVNPAHLECVTQAVNLERRYERERKLYGLPLLGPGHSKEEVLRRQAA